MAEDYALRLSPSELQRYAMMAEQARRSEADLWAQAGLAAGAAVADIGCGPGALFSALVDAVTASGRVVGVDGDAEAVAAAQSLISAHGWPNVTVVRGDADASGLQPGAFDVVQLRHVLAHNGPAEQQIVDHAASLLRAGGHLYLLDAYASGMAIRPTEPDFEDLNTTYLRYHAARGNDLETGLRLRELAAGAGLEVIGYRGWYNIVTPPAGLEPPAWAARDAMVRDGFATHDDVQRWSAALKRITALRPTVFASLFAAVARRPGG